MNVPADAHAALKRSVQLLNFPISPYKCPESSSRPWVKSKRAAATVTGKHSWVDAKKPKPSFKLQKKWLPVKFVDAQFVVDVFRKQDQAPQPT
ncbi:MAG: hypothetical protein R2877_04340 [Bdellovibrionota bacterium]